MNSARKSFFLSQVALVAAALVLACETAQAPTAPVPTLEPIVVPVDESAFSRERAWGHLEALTEHGPRVTGTAGAKQARDYIVSELQRMEIDILPAEAASSKISLPEGTPEPDNVVAEIPGESGDLVVLVAPYDSRQFERFEFVGANDGASGAALLLELADVLRRRPLSYTTWLLFLDAEAPGADTDPELVPRPRLYGSRLQAARFREAGVLPRIRLLVGFNRICDPDLAITRDLGSHRLYREDFWNAAASSGHDDVFRPGQPFETVVSSHLPFYTAGARRVVFISDSAFGGDESPGLFAESEDDDLEHCSAESLQVVGEVTLQALRTITHRLAKIDRFSTSPLANVESEEETQAVPAIEEEPPDPKATGTSTDSETNGDAAGLLEGSSPAGASVP